MRAEEISPAQRPRARSYIHWDPERVDYSVTPEELEKLREGGRSIWKDVCLVSVSLGIPCLINAVAETTRQVSFSLTFSMFLNYLTGVLGLAFGLIFGIAWRRSHQSLGAVVDAIKQKPKMEILPEAVDVGELHLAEPSPTQPSDKMDER